MEKSEGERKKKKGRKGTEEITSRGEGIKI